MPKEMTTRERMQLIFEHKDADRVPIWDEPWEAAIASWHQEGMPQNIEYQDYFGLDKIGYIIADNSPRYPARIIEETADSIISATEWGATIRNWKDTSSTPEFLDFTIKDPVSWYAAKKRMVPDDDRINYSWLENNYAAMRREGHWIIGHLWFGFDVAHSWTVGTESLLVAMIEQPEWCYDMFNHFLDVHIGLFDKIIAAGYKPDCIYWPDDMGYKNTQFFSMDLYRQLLKPVQKKAIDWAHSHGMKTHLHSCGNINPLLPELIEIGLDAINPLEVKAGMDPLSVKQHYGDSLVLHGGINIQLWQNLDEVIAEMERLIPELKKNGGYIFASDHSIPPSVSLKDFSVIIEKAKKLGSYE